ncbi:hypothetical protein Droror1_Dr00028018 [Drosera rotundifolia]
MFQVMIKLRRLKRKLGQLNKVHYSDLNRRIHEAEQEPEKAQSNFRQAFFATNISEVEIKKEKLLRILMIEDAILKQKGKEDWLMLMDRNVGYFYALIKGRRRRNQIMSLMLEDDTWTKEEDIIKLELIKHFQQMLEQTEVNSIHIDENVLKAGKVFTEEYKNGVNY